MKTTIEYVNKTISMNSDASTSKHIVDELNDIKFIMLVIACKLGEDERKDIISALSSIQSPRIGEWLKTFREFTGD
ncbi:hypothetical protein WM46_04715 [Citrobacter freundii complex sp. CFNIH2]|uniref:hypothetical protein n=1 Tax=Citrobacter freundii complex sp. CFNIH2 TaxID=2066049 RepID=UPI000C869B52|nr:hypothetical protein [Citrobacter freundii complex sp. CFNIH2]AUO64114.1 hypothetical protein WM46_04715 [Citrobacter freundii complex sp. CFNIH2]